MSTNPEEFTEPFHLERWLKGEPALGQRNIIATFDYIVKMADGNIVLFTNDDSGRGKIQLSMVQTGTSYANRWKMKPEVSIFDVVKTHQNNLDENPWIPHDGGECPIPWAEAGEFEAEQDSGYVFTNIAAKTLVVWASNSIDPIIAYRLTDRWIPVIGRKCENLIDTNEYEYKTRRGTIVTDMSGYAIKAGISINKGDCPGDIVAVRLIEQDYRKMQKNCGCDASVNFVCNECFKIEELAVATIMDKALKESVQIIHKGKLRSIEEQRAANEQLLFECRMASFNRKLKEKKKAKLQKAIVLPINIAEMMVIAGKAMRDE